jgi:hypothetical protein
VEFDAFTCRLGEGQGRVELASGEVRFVLGDLEPGRRFELSPGDRIQVLQTVDLTSIDLVRVVGEFRAPATMPPGLVWEASVVVDGEKRAVLRCQAGRRRPVQDLAANVSKFLGLHEVGLRLELVQA